MQIKKAHQHALAIFARYWGQHFEIVPEHIAWLQQHVSYKQYKRSDCIYSPEWKEEKLIYVCSGLIARTNNEIFSDSEKQNRTLISIAIPQTALMTTEHLYSHTQGAGEIIALRNTEVFMISYHEIKTVMLNDPDLSQIVSTLLNKKKRQLMRLRQIELFKDRRTAYIKFTEILPELHRLLSQVEQQDLLRISRRTIIRASYFLLTGKNKR